MFVGHYAPALALKPAARRVPLWRFALAVQLVDVAWALLVLAGVEKVRIEPGFLAASDLDLYSMPYTHSLAATFVWMLAAGLVYRLVDRNAGPVGAVAIALAVGSHWCLDFLVHAQDLALWPGGPKVGLGLWRDVWVSMALELGLLALGTLVYVRGTAARGVAGAIAPWAFFALLAALEAYSLSAPPAESPQAFAVSALIAYGAIAGFAAVVDTVRAPIPAATPVR